MSKQSATRSQRLKGFKVKHFVQIFLLLAFGLWILHHVKQSYDTKATLAQGVGDDNGDQILTLGRKNLKPRQDETVTEDAEKNRDEDVESGRENEGDDELESVDKEKTEESEHDQLQDLIDEEDN